MGSGASVGAGAGVGAGSGRARGLDHRQAGPHPPPASRRAPADPAAPTAADAASPVLPPCHPLSQLAVPTLATGVPIAHYTMMMDDGGLPDGRAGVQVRRAGAFGR